MASAETAIYTLLTAGSPNPVAALVGDRVYPLILPQGLTTFPAIRFQRISTPRSQYRTLDGQANYASPRIQIDCWDVDYDGMLDLGEAVYGLLEGFHGTIDGLRIDAISTEDEANDVETDIGPSGVPLFRQRIDVLIMHAE